jgi:hypothetical protein
VSLDLPIRLLTLTGFPQSICSEARREPASPLRETQPNYPTLYDEKSAPRKGEIGAWAPFHRTCLLVEGPDRD